MTTATGTVSDTTGTSGWTNPNNIFSDDGSYAVSGSVANLITTTRIYALGNGFSIPTSATIDGVEVGIKGKNAISSASGFQVVSTSGNGCQLWLSGAALSGTSAKNTTQWTGNTDQTKVMGGATDLWGATSISPTDINDSSFGIRTNIRNNNASSQAFSMNYVYITVYYTDSGGVQSSQQFFSRRF